MILGGALLVEQTIAVVRGLRSQSWPRVQGRILTSVVWQDQSFADRHVFWSPVIQYEYTVQGQRYVGRRISFAQGLSGSLEMAVRLASRRFRRGREVVVQYDPRRPEQAVLVVGVSLGNWLLLPLSAFMLWCGSLALR
jgi:uncharacterized protein DUF3592